MKEVKLTKEQKLQERKNRKALRNTSKRNVTTKSFNKRGNDFTPTVKAERNPDAVLYQQLNNKGLLPKDEKGNNITYKKWQEEKLKDALKR